MVSWHAPVIFAALLFGAMIVVHGLHRVFG